VFKVNHATLNQWVVSYFPTLALKAKNCQYAWCRHAHVVWM